MVRLELPPGEHKLTVKRGAEELYNATFTVKRGAEVVLERNGRRGSFTNSLGMEFVLVPKGKFWLGGGGGRSGEEGPNSPRLLPGQVRGYAGGMGKGHGDTIRAASRQWQASPRKIRSAFRWSRCRGTTSQLFLEAVEQAGARKRAGCTACRRRRNGSTPVGEGRLATRSKSALTFTLTSRPRS